MNPFRRQIAKAERSTLASLLQSRHVMSLQNFTFVTNDRHVVVIVAPKKAITPPR